MDTSHKQAPVISGNTSILIGTSLSLLVLLFLGILRHVEGKELDFGFLLILLFGSFYYGFSIVAGWQFLNKLSHRYFSIVPIIGWIFYVVIKFYLSVFVGIFYLPFWIYKFTSTSSGTPNPDND
jgi:membrane-bound acyltransferase YfiQ involved in biofilm formation